MAINKEIFIYKDIFIYNSLYLLSIKVTVYIAYRNWQQRIGMLQSLFISGSLNSACHTWFTTMVIQLGDWE